MQPTNPAEIAYQLLGELTPTSPLEGLPVASDDQPATQDTTTLYITTMYYSAFANLFLQGILPADIADVDAERPRLKIAIERSYADYTTAATWLLAHDQDLISSSPAKSYYDEVQGLDKGAVKDIAAFYASASR